MKIIKDRLLNIELPPNRSAFLWGPRRTGKTYWVNLRFPDAVLIDLLKTDLFADYASHPSLLRERYQAMKGVLSLTKFKWFLICSTKSIG